MENNFTNTDMTHIFKWILAHIMYVSCLRRYMFVFKCLISGTLRKKGISNLIKKKRDDDVCKGNIRQLIYRKYSTAGLPNLFCVGNFSKIWSVYRQHEVQYTASGMYKYNYIYFYLHIFLYIIYNKNMLMIIWKIYKKCNSQHREKARNIFTILYTIS